MILPCFTPWDFSLLQPELQEMLAEQWLGPSTHRVAFQSSAGLLAASRRSHTACRVSSPLVST